MTVPQAVVLLALSEVADAPPSRRYMAQLEACGHSWTAYSSSPSLALTEVSGFAVAKIREDDTLVPSVHVLGVLAMLGVASSAAVIASTSALVEYRRTPNDPDYTNPSA